MAWEAGNTGLATEMELKSNTREAFELKRYRFNEPGHVLMFRLINYVI